MKAIMAWTGGRAPPAAIEVTAAQREGCSLAWSSTIRTVRVRTSGENLFVVLLATLSVIAPSSQELEPPANPVRFTLSGLSKEKFSRYLVGGFAGLPREFLHFSACLVGRKKDGQAISRNPVRIENRR
jgi:hypothetical protein